MKLRNNRVGKVYGKWKVLRYAGTTKHRQCYWECQCQCGETETLFSRQLDHASDRPCKKCRSVPSGRDLTGVKAYNWVAVRRCDSSHKRYKQMWLCECTCINKTHKLFYGWDIVAKRVSRGCSLCAKDRLLCQKQHSGDTHKQRMFRTRRIVEEKERPMRFLYRNRKTTAKSRGLVWSLTYLQTKAIMQSNCAYCGIEAVQVFRKGTRYEITYNGIDRVDSSLGYVFSNVVPCCTACNLAKHAMTKDEFLSWVERVYHHSIDNGAAL